jgi:hypothetical protein
MTARTGYNLLAAVVVCIVLAWITFPAVLYAYHWFIYPLYYYPFRHRNLVQEFPMRWELLPPSVVNQRSLQQPVWLRFEENPNFGILIEGSQVGPLDSSRGAAAPVLLSLHGDRRKGALGFSVQRIGPVDYGPTKVSALYISCPATPAGCGVNPLGRVICKGPCREPE